MKLNFLNDKKIPKDFRKAVTPDPEFARRAKGRFMATFEAQYPAVRTAGYFGTFAAKSLVAVLACIGVMAAVSVYADTANVPADSSLYGLKRLTENVQLAFTITANKPQLQATFAERRAVEIDDLEERHPSSTMLPVLTNDLTVAASTSLADADKGKLASATLNAVCKTLLLAIATSTPSDIRFHGNKNIFDHFENTCANTKTDITTSTSDDGEGSGPEASTTATTTATSSRGRGGFHLHIGGHGKGSPIASSSESVNATTSVTATSSLHFHGGFHISSTIPVSPTTSVSAGGAESSTSHTHLDLDL